MICKGLLKSRLWKLSKNGGVHCSTLTKNVVRNTCSNGKIHGQRLLTISD